MNNGASIALAIAVALIGAWAAGTWLKNDQIWDKQVGRYCQNNHAGVGCPRDVFGFRDR